MNCSTKYCKSYAIFKNYSICLQSRMTEKEKLEALASAALLPKHLCSWGHARSKPGASSFLLGRPPPHMGAGTLRFEPSSAAFLAAYLGTGLEVDRQTGTPMWCWCCKWWLNCNVTMLTQSYVNSCHIVKAIVIRKKV